MNAEQIAQALHAKLHAHDYPYLAPTLHRSGAFPRVELWNDRFPAEQVIVCYEKPEQRHEAQIFALWIAQRMLKEGAPCGVVASIATHDLEVIDVD